NAFKVTFNKEYFNLEWLYYLLISLDLRKFSSSTAQPVISGKRIYPIVIGIPPLEEQKRIVEKIDELFKVVDSYDELDKKLERLNSNFPSNMEKSVLQYAMQGKLVPQVPSEGSAQQLLDKLVKEKKDLILNKSIPKQLEPLPISKDE